MWGIVLIVGGAIVGGFVLRGAVFLVQDVNYYKRKEREDREARETGENTEARENTEAGTGEENKIIRLDVINNADINKMVFAPKQ